MLSHFSCVRLFVTLWTVAHQDPLSMGFSRQEYWSGLPCPSSGDLPDPGIEPASLMSPALQADSLSTELPGKADLWMWKVNIASTVISLWMESNSDGLRNYDHMTWLLWDAYSFHFWVLSCNLQNKSGTFLFHCLFCQLILQNSKFEGIIQAYWPFTVPYSGYCTVLYVLFYLILTATLWTGSYFSQFFVKERSLSNPLRLGGKAEIWI